MQQPSLPDMEPIRPSAAPAPPPIAPSAPTAPAPPAGMSRRLRQATGYLVGGSLSVFLLIGGAQLALRPGLRPTDLMAIMEAQTEIGIFNQRLGLKPGEQVVNEAQYREIIAEAERKGTARAELDLQRQLNVLQADRERLVQAYGALYNRANAIAQAGLQMEAQAQAFRQQLISMTNGGRSVVIGVKDIFCGIGDAQSCDSARRDREAMVGESTGLTGGDTASKIRALMSGIDDPATFVVRKDIERNGAPRLP